MNVDLWAFRKKKKAGFLPVHAEEKENFQHISE
jgi:hypothetical protein